MIGRGTLNVTTNAWEKETNTTWKIAAVDRFDKEKFW